MSSNKRKAPYQLNEGNLSDDEHAGPELGKVSTPEEIASRRILKVKGHGSDQASAPAKLVLHQKLDETQQPESKEDNATTASETTNGDKKEVTEEKKAIQFKSESSLFGNNNGTASSGLFANIPASSTSSGLFGNISSSVFNNTSSSLFGNSSSAGTGLFANIKKDDGPKITNIFETDKPSGSIFGNSTATTSLFSNTKTPTASSLFGNLQKNTAQAGGLFTNNNNNEGSEDEGAEGDEDDELEHSPEIDPSKVEMQFEYHNPYEKVIDKSIVKLRRGNKDVLEKGYVSFEKFKSDEKTPNIFIYRDQIKKVIFTLNVHKKIVKVEKIANSTKNLKFIFFKKEDDKIVPDVIKVQFQDEKEGEDFFNKFKEYLEN